MIDLTEDAPFGPRSVFIRVRRAGTREVGGLQRLVDPASIDGRGRRRAAVGHAGEGTGCSRGIQAGGRRSGPQRSFSRSLERP